MQGHSSCYYSWMSSDSWCLSRNLSLSLKWSNIAPDVLIAVFLMSVHRNVTVLIPDTGNFNFCSCPARPQVSCFYSSFNFSGFSLMFSWFSSLLFYSTYLPLVFLLYFFQLEAEIHTHTHPQEPHMHYTCADRKYLQPWKLSSLRPCLLRNRSIYCCEVHAKHCFSWILQIVI
jgi:hypothetical protein